MIRRLCQRCQRDAELAILLAVDEPLPQLRPAGPAKRFLATLIDLPLGYAPTFLVGLIVRLWWRSPGAGGGIDVASLWNQMGFGGQLVVYIALFLGGPWYYQAVFEQSGWQATPGKRWLGVHVADSQDRPLSFGSALGRSILKYVINGFLLLAPLSLLTMLIDKDRRALHDFVARTKTFRGQPVADSGFAAWQLILWPTLPVFAVGSMAALYLW